MTKDRKLYMSEAAAEALQKGKVDEGAKAKREAEAEAKREARRKKEEERKVRRDKIKILERAALDSDKRLDKALDKLEEETDAERKRYTRTELLQARSREADAEILKFQKQIEKLRAVKVDSGRKILEIADEDPVTALEEAEEAYSEHHKAWAEVGQAFRKKNRDRAVRKRAREAKLKGGNGEDEA